MRLPAGFAHLALALLLGAILPSHVGAGHVISRLGPRPHPLGGPRPVRLPQLGQQVLARTDQSGQHRRAQPLRAEREQQVLGGGVAAGSGA